MDKDNNNTPLPSDNDNSTTQIKWTIDSVTVIAERNEVDRWNVYAKQDGIIVSDVTQNVAGNELLFVVNEYKKRYHSKSYLSQ